MRKNLLQWLRPVLFTLGGATAGLIYYFAFSCTSGCVITANPLIITFYMGTVGWLISGILMPERKET